MITTIIIKKINNMKRMELKRNGNALVMFIALMFAASMLTTGCGTGQATTSSVGTYVHYDLTNDCALLHIYRPGKFTGAGMNYDLHLSEWPLCTVANKTKTTIRITREGSYTLWAKTEITKELPLNIQFGNEYYIRCGVGFGVLVGRPTLEYVDPQTGKYEFDQIPWRN
jgi:hypothetical protein